ncbi:hypothetical protein [Nocardia australiensis]|uniref:hypothetical protein n=1 Tax=Nocardia australiensis TaxID=2887191 RepID=UPI001D13363A|nr:hypothetical protein [Nocardia australiensis]
MLLGVLAVVSLAGAGCGSMIDRVTAPDVETSTSPELVKEATEFGGWTLPADGKILLVEKEVMRDSEFRRIAVEMSPTDVASMLEKSGFTTALDKVRDPSPPYITTIAGPDLATSPNVQRAQDTFYSQAEKTISRTVVVDERDAETRIVHIEFSHI